MTLHKNIRQLFIEQESNRFVVPLYQRNFAWGEEEISQLLDDIREAWVRSDGSSHYFIGSIVYIKRGENIFEIIDGQQRLTVMSLLLHVINERMDAELSPKKRLSYESRDDVSKFLDDLFEGKNPKADTDNTALFQAALDEMNLHFNGERADSIFRNLSVDDFKSLSNFILDNLVFVFAELPPQTDVAEYFEIMNNTGEQLKKHEILKAKLLETALEEDMPRLAKVWDACSQMNIPIQLAFDPADRTLLFGDNLTGFVENGYKNISKIYRECNSEIFANGFVPSLSNIINSDFKLFDENPSASKGDDDDDDDENSSMLKSEAIIDFPNFLMHIFRLLFPAENIPLNEKNLLDAFTRVSKRQDFDSARFIEMLLYCRVVFDRFMVRNGRGTARDRQAILDEGESNWQLFHIIKNDSKRYPKNTFSDSREQDQALMALSMLQVTYPQRKYNNVVADILHWIWDNYAFDFERISAAEYISHLHEIMLNRMSELNLEDEMNAGENTSRFLLNFIDYLYYLRDQRGNSRFRFKYYNTREHHLPRKLAMVRDCEDVINNIGNIYLLGRRANSSLNDDAPEDKRLKVIKDIGKENITSLSPKRYRMFELTENGWDKGKIIAHNMEIEDLLSQADSLMKI